VTEKIICKITYFFAIIQIIVIALRICFLGKVAKPIDFSIKASKQSKNQQ